jgi:hypothetical protein
LTVQHRNKDVVATTKALLNVIMRLKSPSYRTADLRVRSIHGMTHSCPGIKASSAPVIIIDGLALTCSVKPSTYAGVSPGPIVRSVASIVGASTLCQRATDAGGTVMGLLMKATASIFEWSL